jgi:hypothetical protein
MANETYTLIQKATVGSAGATSIEFTSIPQTFTDLVVRSSLRSDQANLYASSTISLNNSTSNFTYRFVYGEGAAAASFSGSTNLSADQNGDTATANTFSNFDMYIPNYTSSNYKSISQDSVTENNGTTAYAELGALLWSNTAAITSIKLSPASTKVWKQYSSISLYGVAKLGVSPVAGPKASGGDIITNDGTYWIHQFLNSGTFTPSSTLSCDYLVVAGGGGGGNAQLSNSLAGGGGAGGFRSTVTATGGGGSLEAPLSLTAQAYTVTVGAGGTVAGSINLRGGNGNNSVFSTITSTAGGGGGGGNETPNSGGSGGGGCMSRVGASGTANQGFAGGSSTNDGGSGGGGAGAVGSGTASQAGANGGAGVATSISGSSVTYAGGGGGGGTSLGTGGSGGGGNGGDSSIAAVNGTVNRGAGGGGGTAYSGKEFGGAGGSGIVIIRYAI